MTRTTRPTRTLPEHPDRDQLRRQAKELVDAYQSGDAAASAEVHEHHRAGASRTFALHDAQLVVARAYGFDSWPKLKAHVAGMNGKRFITAAAANDLGAVAAMLKSRPDLIDTQWSYGDERRALHHAVMNRAPEMVRLLMRHGANPRVGVHPHRDATTPRTLAVERGFHEIVSIIDDEESNNRSRSYAAPAETSPPHTRTAPRDAGVEAAIVRGDVGWLITRQAKRPLVNVGGWDAGGLLTRAAVHNQLEVLRLFLDLGFDPDERVRWSEGPDAAYSLGYPLWHCAATGKHALAELLLTRGASPNVHVDSSGSAVYAAYSHRQWGMVDLLTRHGGVVTPDIVGLYRETQLARGILDTNGASLPEGSLPPGRTLEDYLLEFALSGGAADIVRMALERMDWPREDPRWFRMLVRGLDFWNHIPGLQAGNPEFDRSSYITGFRMLVARCDPNVIGGFGQTPLHELGAAGAHVTADEAAALAAMLLDASARLDVRDELFRSTPLAWACRWGRPEVVKVLLEHGADPVERESERWASPRAWAEKMDREGVLMVLREYGA